MKKSYFFAGVAILVWSSMATVSKLLLGSMNGMRVLWISSLFAGIFLLLFNIVTGNIQKLTTYTARDYIITVLCGLPGACLYNLFYYWGAARLPASQAFIINYLWPMMSILFAVILLGERMTVRKVIALLLSFGGVICVAGNDLFSFHTNTLLGIAFCVSAAVSYGLFTALNQKVHYDKSLSMMLSSFATFLIAVWFDLPFGDALSISTFGWLGLLFNGVFVLAVGSTAWTKALESGKTATISNLAYLTPFLSLVWTRLFLNEQITWSAVGGLLLIVCGIFIQLKDNKTTQ